MLKAHQGQRPRNQPLLQACPGSEQTILEIASRYTPGLAAPYHDWHNRIVAHPVKRPQGWERRHPLLQACPAMRPNKTAFDEQKSSWGESEEQSKESVTHNAYADVEFIRPEKTGHSVGQELRRKEKV